MHVYIGSAFIYHPKRHVESSRSPLQDKTRSKLAHYARESDESCRILHYGSICLPKMAPQGVTCVAAAEEKRVERVLSVQ